MKSPDCQGLYSDGRHYDRQHKGITDDIPFYLRQARKCGGPVLELACGTGRIALVLAQEGIPVSGLDISEPMLAEARRKAAAAGLNIDLIHADCRDFDLAARFKLIFLPFNSIAHLHDLESIEACFSAVERHLASSGRFIVDIFNPRLDILLRSPSERYPVAEYPDPDGRGTVVVTENNVYDTATQVNRIRWYYRIGQDGKEVVHKLNMRVFFPQELDSLLVYNGFFIEAKYGDYDETPFGSDSPKQIPVCRLA
jgi:SAM-dependent methyltransferase